MTVGQTLGESYDPLGAHLQDPYTFYARARQERPVFWSPVVNAWVITRRADVVEVLRNPEVFSSAGALRPLTPVPPATAAVMRQGYPYTPPAWNQDGEGHRRLRAPVARGLSAARVDALEPFIRQRVETLVDAFAASESRSAELMSQLADQLPISVIAHLCNLTPEDARIAYDGSYRGNQVLFDTLPEPQRTAAARASVAFQQMCGRYVRDRRMTPGDDLISQVVTSLAPGTEPLSYDQETQLARTVFILVLAGHVTTSALIGGAVRHLLADRRQWELLCEQPERIPQAVEEAARYDTPTHAILRTVTREVTVGGQALSEGADVLVVFAAANRDPELCDRPEIFDITRPPVRHVAFGTGPHACVGATLGRRQATVALEVLTRRLPGMRLASGQDFRVQGTLMIRGLTELHVTW